MSMTQTITAMMHYLYEHPMAYQLGPRDYQNEVTLMINGNILFPGGDEIFPDNRLHAVRMPANFSFQEPELGAWFARLINKEKPNVNPREVWVTGGHISSVGKHILQVTYE